MEFHLLCISDTANFSDKDILIFHPTLIALKKKKYEYQLSNLDSKSEIENKSDLTTSEIVLIFPTQNKEEEFPNFFSYSGNIFLRNSKIPKIKLMFIQELLNWQENNQQFDSGYEYVTSDNHSMFHSILLFTIENKEQRSRSINLKKVAIISSAVIGTLAGVIGFSAYSHEIAKNELRGRLNLSGIQTKIDNFKSDLEKENYTFVNLDYLTKTFQDLSSQLQGLKPALKAVVQGNSGLALEDIKEEIQSVIKNIPTLKNDYDKKKEAIKTQLVENLEKLKNDYKDALSNIDLFGKIEKANDEYQEYLKGKEFNADIENLFKSADNLGLKEIIESSQVDILNYDRVLDLDFIYDNFKNDNDPAFTLFKYVVNYYKQEGNKQYDDQFLTRLNLKILNNRDFFFAPFNINIEKLKENMGVLPDMEFDEYELSEKEYQAFEKVINKDVGLLDAQIKNLKIIAKSKTDVRADMQQELSVLQETKQEIEQSIQKKVDEIPQTEVRPEYQEFYDNTRKQQLEAEIKGEQTKLSRIEKQIEETKEIIKTLTETLKENDELVQLYGRLDSFDFEKNIKEIYTELQANNLKISDFIENPYFINLVKENNPYGDSTSMLKEAEQKLTERKENLEKYRKATNKHARDWTIEDIGTIIDYIEKETPEFKGALTDLKRLKTDQNNRIFSMIKNITLPTFDDIHFFTKLNVQNILETLKSNDTKFTEINRENIINHLNKLLTTDNNFFTKENLFKDELNSIEGYKDFLLSQKNDLFQIYNEEGGRLDTLLREDHVHRKDEMAKILPRIYQKYLEYRTELLEEGETDILRDLKEIIDSNLR